MASVDLSACDDAESTAEQRLLDEVAAPPRLNTSERVGNVAVSLRRDSMSPYRAPRKLGVKDHEAVTHGCSHKGPWTKSSSRAVHEALSLDYLANGGLASLLTIWQTLTAKDLNRPVRTRSSGGVGGTQPQD